MKATMTTLQTLCNENPSIMGIRCRYTGQPNPYIVDGISKDVAERRVMKTLDSALKIAALITTREYRVVLEGSKQTILIIRHPTLAQCHIAVLYKTASPIGKSIRRMVRKQFKNFTYNSIGVTSTEIQLTDTLAGGTTHVHHSAPSNPPNNTPTTLNTPNSEPSNETT